MNGHLPECPAGYVADLCTTDIDPVLQEPTCNHCVGQGCICICNRLRTCEQRVRHEGDVGPNRGGVHHELCGCDDDEPLCEPEDCPYCSCWRLRACEQRVWKDPLLVVSRRAGWNDALIAARAALARTHRPVPVIECGGTCGWGKDCPECGIQSNRIVGYVCDACCNSFGDHAYCDDLHYEDTPLHHQDDQMWSGPHCPTLAAIDALKEKQ